MKFGPAHKIKDQLDELKFRVFVVGHKGAFYVECRATSLNQFEIQLLLGIAQKHTLSLVVYPSTGELRIEIGNKT